MGEGDLVLAWYRVFVFVFVLLALPASVSAAIGKVLSVQQGAEVIRSGKTITLREGMEVVSGDTIATNRSGVVQLIFADETKIAVGPNARMVLDVTMLRSNRKAKSFAVQALGGSFRFISGKSRKRAYSVETPQATMAVRGTTFDMWIVPGTQSAMLVLEGTVRMCGRRGSCRSTGRQCSLFATTQNGSVGRPADPDQYDLALKNGFPFVQSQISLLTPLQVDVGGCSGESAPLPVQKSDAPEPRPERPQRAAFRAEVSSDPPSEAPAPEPASPEPRAPEPPAPEPPASEPPASEPPAPEPEAARNRSGHQDGSNPAGQTGNSGGYDNPGKGKGPGHGKGKGKKGST